MSFGMVGQVNQWMAFLTEGVKSPNGKEQFFGGGIGQHNVGLTYRRTWHCGVDVAYPRLSGPSEVGIAQLVAHAADESILCVWGGNVAVPKLL